VSQSFWVGIGLILLAGLMAGDCMLPLKFNRKWRWENTWLMFSLVSLLILPWTLALLLVNHLFQAYNSLTAYWFVTPILFGAGWGIAPLRRYSSEFRFSVWASASHTQSWSDWGRFWEHWFHFLFNIGRWSVGLF